MSVKKNEASVKACYSTWGATYYDNYYGKKAAYPPVHSKRLRKLLSEAGAKSLLDAGCGPASFLREVAKDGMDIYGFDLTPEMVDEAKRVLKRKGVPADHIWQGSVLSPKSFLMPGSTKPRPFDAAICIGVFPHIPEDADITAIKNLRNAVKKNGLVVVEARNQLFSLFTQNRYSYRFFSDELIQSKQLKAKAGPDAPKLEGVLKRYEKHFRMDLPPVRKGEAGKPGYDEVLSRAHNPIVLKEQFATAGFKDVKVLFYHYHCLPPMFEREVPELFHRESLAMEDPSDWRGYFMASAFLLAGRRS